MNIIQESKVIVGTLVTQGQKFDMLELSPSKRSDVPFWMMQDVYQFLIVNGQGFAQPIIVSHGGFYILPALEKKAKLVQFVVEEEQSEKIENSIALTFADKIQS